MTGELVFPEPNRTALLVIDMQNGFLSHTGSCARVGFPVAELAAAVAPCRHAMASARKAGSPIVFTRYTYRPDFKDGGFMLREKFPMLAQAGALVSGSEDQALIDGFASGPRDLMIDKNRPSAFIGTSLDSHLADLGTRDIVVCGVTTSCCVESTVRDAAQRDFRTFVLSDATADWDKDRHQAALTNMGLLFAHVVTTQELAQAWA